jgi:flagellar motor switch protein FliM
MTGYTSNYFDQDSITSLACGDLDGDGMDDVVIGDGYDYSGGDEAGEVTIMYSPHIAYAIVERAFGGPGSDDQPQRALTEIELGIIQRIFQDTFLSMQEAWRNVADIEPVLDGVETNPVFIQTGGPTEVVAAITLAVEIGEHMGHMTYAFPYSTVEPVLSKLSPQSWLAESKHMTDADQQILRRSVQEAPLILTALLGRTGVKLGEFIALQVGDVIPLDAKVSGEIPIYVGNRVAFQGVPGVVGDRMSVQIRRRVADLRDS